MRMKSEGKKLYLFTTNSQDRAVKTEQSRACMFHVSFLEDRGKAFINFVTR